MKFRVKQVLILLVFMIPTLSNAAINIGIGKADITPMIGTPSAGYTERRGAGMQGVHDSLSALALFIDNGEKQIALCSVDHLGFTYEMVQRIIEKVHSIPQLKGCDIYISSSHTHSGGGAYLNIPRFGESLAGTYDPEVTKFYEEKTAEAIIQASQNSIPAKIGIGYGKAENLSTYRSKWPLNVTPVTDVVVLKVTNLNGEPLAALFNFAVHPTVLNGQNRLFSSDFVGYARSHLQSILGQQVQAIYLNGAQGDISPVISDVGDRFAACEFLGQSLAETVKKIWFEVETNDTLDIKTERKSYSFKPQATPFGLKLPVSEYKTEMNLIVLNQTHAFITIPGELSCIYDQQLKEIALELGYQHLSIFGLTNDAHGYIILPEAWSHKTAESGLSFGGESYGELTKNRAEDLLKYNAP